MVNFAAAAAVSPFAAGVKALNNIVNRNRHPERFQDSPVEEEDPEISTGVLVVIVLIILALFITMCVCWYNILPDDFIKPLHMLAFIFATGLYFCLFLLYVGLIDPYVLTEKKSKSKK